MALCSTPSCTKRFLGFFSIDASTGVVNPVQLLGPGHWEAALYTVSFSRGQPGESTLSQDQSKCFCSCTFVVVVVVVIAAAVVVVSKRTITILDFLITAAAFFFQIFVLSDSTKLSLELGVPLEFVHEKRNEIKRCVVCPLLCT